jgi:MFS family permease
VSRAVPELMVARFFTGCGIGGVVPAMASFAAEFTPLRSRNFSVTLVQGGYTLGATLTGVLAAWLIPAFGWQSLFALGGVLSLAGIALVFVGLPESPDFLLGRRPAGGLAALNTTLRAMGQPALAELPPAPAKQAGAFSVRDAFATLFSSRYRQPTLLLWLAFFTSLAALYFLQTWVPKLVADQGLSDAQAYWSGTILNAGLFVGMASVGWVADRFGLRRTISTYLGLAALVLMSFVYLGSANVMLAGLGVLGVLQGGFIGLYAVGARLYPTEIRTTGLVRRLPRRRGIQHADDLSRVRGTARDRRDRRARDALARPRERAPQRRQRLQNAGVSNTRNVKISTRPNSIANASTILL